MLPELLDRQNGLLQQPTQIYDRSGENLLLTLENPGIPRSSLSIDPQQADSFAPIFIQTTISLNDPRFWQHAGFQWHNLTHPQPQTLAEQLVHDLMLENEPPGLRRNLRMAPAGRPACAALWTRPGAGMVPEQRLLQATWPMAPERCRPALPGQIRP